MTAKPETAAEVLAANDQTTVYVECRLCDKCEHVGINDAHHVAAACLHCEWNGPEPVEDKCPGCGSDGTMTAACPKCCGRYMFMTDTEIPVQAERALSAQGYPRIVAWSRTNSIRDANGYPIGTDATETRWQSECPDPNGGWAPLYDGPNVALSAQGEAVAAYRLRTGAPRTRWQWMDGKPSAGAIQEAELHGWEIEYAYTHPAPARVTEEMVERVWMAATGRARLGKGYENDARCMTAEERADIRAALEADHG